MNYLHRIIFISIVLGLAPVWGEDLPGDHVGKGPSKKNGLINPTRPNAATPPPSVAADYPRVSYERSSLTGSNGDPLEQIEKLPNQPVPWYCGADNSITNGIALARDRFSKLQPDRQELYRETHKTQSEKALKEALASGQIGDLIRVAQHHQFTAAGERALHRVIMNLVNNGEVVAAELYFTSWRSQSTSKEKCTQIGTLKRGLFIYKALNKPTVPVLEELTECFKEQKTDDSPMGSIEKVQTALNHYSGSADSVLKYWEQKTPGDPVSQQKAESHVRSAVTYANTGEAFMTDLLKALGAPVLVGKFSFCDVYDPRSTRDLMTARSPLLQLFSSRRIPDLIKLLADEDNSVRNEATRILRAIKNEAIEPLIGTLSNENPVLQTAAARVLELMGPDASLAVPALVTALGVEDDGVKQAAAHALGGIGDKARTALPALIKLLSDKSDLVRIEGVRAIGSIGSWAVGKKPIIQISAVIEALKDRNAKVREMAAQVLGEIPEGAVTSVPALITALQDVDEMVRDTAAQSLGHLGSKSKAAVSALVSAISDRYPNVRRSAVWALGQIGEDSVSALTALKEHLKSPLEIHERAELEGAIKSIETASKKGTK